MERNAKKLNRAVTLTISVFHPVLPVSESLL